MKRYPGAQPFSTEQRRVFFGREQELDALRRVVESEPMVVLFAKSGMGKSSLLNAGLIAEVQKAGRFSPISIRFGAHMEGGEATPLELAREQLAIGSKQEKSFLEKMKPKNEDSLWYHLKNRQLVAENLNNFLLIFDQFEELFTYPEADISAFGRQLSELLFTDIPDRFREKLEAGLEKNPGFLSESELRELHRPLNLRVVMAIRSDRMSLLNKLAPYLPYILENCHELKALNRQQAESAILEPAYLSQEKYGFDSPIFDFEDEAVEKLLDFLSEKGKQEIESFQLQILCEYAERAVVLKKKRPRVTAADFAKPDVILENYYLDKIAELPKNERLPARKLIEEGLIFEEEERRLSLYEGQILKTYGVSENLLQRLLNTHLIRSEPSLRGGYTYELSHDTLVAPVLKAKAKRLEEERKIAEEKERQRLEHEIAERARAEAALERAEYEKRLRLQADRRLRYALIISIVAVILAIFAGWQYFAAEKAREEAVTNFERLKIAQEAKMKLERQNIIQKAETYEQASEYWLAHESWRTALQLDSTASDAAYIREQIERCEKLLRE